MTTKSVLVTGSSSGLGQQTALVFAERGYRVFAGVRRHADARRLAALHERIVPIQLDVTDPAQLASAVDTVDATCGDDGLAVLVNAAGNGLYGPIEYTSRADAAALFNVLTFGPIELTNALLPALKRFASRGRQRAKVLNVISWASLDASPFVGFYAAAKAATLRLTQAQFFELAPFGIDAIAVVPGLMKTPFIEKVEGQIGDALARLPEDGRRDYGTGLLHMASMSRSAGKNPLAASPDKVARRLLAIAEKRRARDQYNLGMDTSLVRFLNFAVPFCVLRVMKNAIFGLNARPARVLQDTTPRLMGGSPGAS